MKKTLLTTFALSLMVVPVHATEQTKEVKTTETPSVVAINEVEIDPTKRLVDEKVKQLSLDDLIAMQEDMQAVIGDGTYETYTSGEKLNYLSTRLYMNHNLLNEVNKEVLLARGTGDIEDMQDCLYLLEEENQQLLGLFYDLEDHFRSVDLEKLAPETAEGLTTHLTTLIEDFQSFRKRGGKVSDTIQHQKNRLNKRNRHHIHKQLDAQTNVDEKLSLWRDLYESGDRSVYQDIARYYQEKGQAVLFFDDTFTVLEHALLVKEETPYISVSDLATFPDITIEDGEDTIKIATRLNDSWRLHKETKTLTINQAVASTTFLLEDDDIFYVPFDTTMRLAHYSASTETGIYHYQSFAPQLIDTMEAEVLTTSLISK